VSTWTMNELYGEDDDETLERWAATRRKRIAEGKCWQCAKLVAECRCPNVKHAADRATGAGQ
jgi:hypothetical protein